MRIQGALIIRGIGSNNFDKIRGLGSNNFDKNQGIRVQ